MKLQYSARMYKQDTTVSNADLGVNNRTIYCHSTQSKLDSIKYIKQHSDTGTITWSPFLEKSEVH